MALAEEFMSPAQVGIEALKIAGWEAVAKKYPDKNTVEIAEELMGFLKKQ